MEKPATKYDESSIRSLSVVEHIRLRPALYFQHVFEMGNLNALPLEMACHAIDEYMDGNCDQLQITLFEDSFQINYNCGMSLETQQNSDLTLPEKLFTKIYTCSNLKKHLEVGDKFCRTGVMVVNSAAEWCEVVTVANGQQGTFKFEAGVLTQKVIIPAAMESYTQVTFKPDTVIFGDLTFDIEGVKKEVKEVSQEFSGLNITVMEG